MIFEYLLHLILIIKVKGKLYSISRDSLLSDGIRNHSAVKKLDGSCSACASQLVFHCFFYAAFSEDIIKGIALHFQLFILIGIDRTHSAYDMGCNVT